ncbi:MAG: multidrug efflux RND transporter permease subunit [Betaproteobacteria bacterium]|nr:multidrug efflux RND transporter permease subunit [Rhodocyclales bacterium]
MFRFFIDRPIFASVISLVIVIAGLVALTVLPVAEYPEVAPPMVQIRASYPGATPETIAKTVAAPIEEQLSGIDGLLFFNSSATADGGLNITVTFETGTNADQATINVNNRVQIATPRLPEEVRRNGVTVLKRSNDVLMLAALNSPDHTRDPLFLSNYATLNVADEIKRVPGVGDLNIFPARDYSMRIWLKPDRMAQLGITAGDIANAIRAQNAQYAAGKIGQNPAPAGQALVYTVTTGGRLERPEEFANIVLRANGAGGVLRLKDVARVELGAQSYDQASIIDGNPSVVMMIFLQSGANALSTVTAVHAKLEELKLRFPDGMNYTVPFDSTRVVSASIHEVLTTLGIAAVLVVAVVFAFLQNWRATAIPMIAVPVSLIGTAAGLWLFGFSINQFTLFAMVLAIGIVVDDAIVVLENVERLMRTEGLSARDAAIEAMREVAGAVVAIVLVLCAVFVPVAFLGGIAGKLYQQFAVTIATAVVISGIVALTLTPALCALLLRPSDHEAPIFHPFNVGFARLSQAYLGTVRWMLGHSRIGLLLFLAVIGAVAGLLRFTPTSFVPGEDRGLVLGSVILPDAASLERTTALVSSFLESIAKEPGIEHVSALLGMDLIGGANKPSAATMFVSLVPWNERSATAQEYAKKFFGPAQSFRQGLIMFFNPAPIRGIGSAGGFEVYLQNRADADPKHLAGVMQLFMDGLKANPKLAGVTTFYRPSSPQLLVDVDREKAISLGVPISEVFDALQSVIGSLYVNDFNKFGRTYRVQMQAAEEFRAKPEDIRKLYVRGSEGAMIPLAALVKVKNVLGPEQLERYNGFLAAKIMGGSVPGVSSGEAIRIVEDTAAQLLPAGYSIAWTGQAFQEKRTGKAAVIALSFGIVMVLLILAAQYEKWSLPLAVILAVPFAALGALLAVLARGMPNDVYFQIGMVVLIGLASKNAILIVEFAAQKRAEGMSAVDAALEAARLRFRPILMTSLAFVLGVLPLVLATGAGAAARRSMGTGVFGGMLAATFIATLFIPLFYTWLDRGKHVMPVGDASHQAEQLP